MLFNNTVKTDDFIFEYESSLGGYVLTGVRNTYADRLVVPARVKSKPVKGIGQFFPCPVFSDSIASVVYLPTTITYFGSMCFADCSVKHIGYSGTMRQWRSIGGRDQMACYHTVTVHCSDGVLTQN